MNQFYANSSPMEAVLDRLRMAGPDMSKHLELMDNIDWTATSLGSLDSWPQELATQFFLSMLIPNPQNLVIGSEKVVIYNQAYGSMIRDYHPRYFGTPVASWTEWSPYFPKMVDIFEKAETSGRAYVEEDFLMFLPKNGIQDEVHFQCAVICLPPPLKGYLGSFLETSAKIAREKRAHALQELVASWKTATNLDSLWRIVLGSFSKYPELFPFAALYVGTLPSEEAGNVSDSSGNDSEDFIYALEGVAGTLSPSCLEAPQHFDLGPSGPTEDAPFRQYFQDARATRAPVLVDGAKIPEGLQKIAQSRGYGDDCRGAVVCPSSTNRLSRVQAFLVMGLATRNVFDDTYKEWITKLQREFSDVVASIKSAQEAIRKRRDSARRIRVERELLNKEIAIQKKEAELAAVRIEKISKIAGLADVGIFEHDLDGRITFANEAFYRITGNPRDARLDVVTDKSNLPTEHWNALLHGEARTYETKFRSGSWGLCSNLPSVDEHGRVDAIIGVVTNIESQKRAEQEAIAKVEALERVRSGERRFYKFLEIVPAGIMIINTDRVATFATEEWFKVTGYNPCSVEQIDWLSIIAEEDRGLVNDAWRTLSVEGKPVEFETRLVRQWTNSTGQHCGNAWILCKGLPEFNDDGTVQQIVSAITDISHLKFVENVQRTRVEEAVEAKKQQENFVDLVSHEIRNPLGAVIHCSDSVFESLEDMSKLTSSWQSALDEQPNISTEDVKRLADLVESAIDAVETVISCTGHQRRIVDDILTLSKLDANLLRISPSPVRTNSILQDIQKMFEVEAERVNVTLKTVIDPSVLELNAERVVVDPGRVMQILINLVTNALKFTKKAHKREVIVRMGASTAKPLDLEVDFALARGLQDSIFETADFAENTCYLWFTVQDTGCGMNVEEKNRIFSRFGQGSIRTYNVYGGSGLGLFISRTLVELQGGEIGAFSEPGKGSTFAFFVRTHLATAPPQTTLPHRHDPSHTEDSTTHDKATPINQRVLQKQLTKNGYIVHVANNGQEALDFLKTTRVWKGNQTSKDAAEIDVILMDVEMPVMDGITCVKCIRALQSTGDICTANLPVIATSANARIGQINVTIAAGMDDSITKPFRIPELTPKIDTFAAWSRSKRRSIIN